MPIRYTQVSDASSTRHDTPMLELEDGISPSGIPQPSGRSRRASRPTSSSARREADQPATDREDQRHYRNAFSMVRAVKGYRMIVVMPEGRPASGWRFPARSARGAALRQLPSMKHWNRARTRPAPGFFFPASSSRMERAGKPRIPGSRILPRAIGRVPAAFGTARHRGTLIGVGRVSQREPRRAPVRDGAVRVAHPVVRRVDLHGSRHLRRLRARHFARPRPGRDFLSVSSTARGRDAQFARTRAAVRTTPGRIIAGRRTGTLRSSDSGHRACRQGREVPQRASTCRPPSRHRRRCTDRASRRAHSRFSARSLSAFRSRPTKRHRGGARIGDSRSRRTDTHAVRRSGCRPRCSRGEEQFWRICAWWLPTAPA